MSNHESNLRLFAIGIIVVEVIVMILYGLFLRVAPQVTATDNSFYIYYQDVNVMMLIGFGFLMTFIKRGSWSSLAYTFFINAIIVQLYILLQAFWHRVFHDGWNEYYIEIS
jgi:ammonium transporter Rh